MNYLTSSLIQNNEYLSGEIPVEIQSILSKLYDIIYLILIIIIIIIFSYYISYFYFSIKHIKYY